MLSYGYLSVCCLLLFSAHRGIPHPFIFPFLPLIPILGRTPMIPGAVTTHLSYLSTASDFGLSPSLTLFDESFHFWTPLSPLV
jgi:hypothetical protein